MSSRMGQCHVHHQAPPVTDGVSPFTTPGTRLTWSSIDEWTAAAEHVLARRCSAKAYVDQANHLDELARHPDFIAAHDRAALERLHGFIVCWYRPHRGSRASTSYERIVNEINNQLHWLSKESA